MWGAEFLEQLLTGSLSEAGAAESSPRGRGGGGPHLLQGHPERQCLRGRGRLQRARRRRPWRQLLVAALGDEACDLVEGVGEVPLGLLLPLADARLPAARRRWAHIENLFRWQRQCRGEDRLWGTGTSDLSTLGLEQYYILLHSIHLSISLMAAANRARSAGRHADSRRGFLSSCSCLRQLDCTAVPSTTAQ